MCDPMHMAAIDGSWVVTIQHDEKRATSWPSKHWHSHVILKRIKAEKILIYDLALYKKNLHKNEKIQQWFFFTCFLVLDNFLKLKII